MNNFAFALIWFTLAMPLMASPIPWHSDVTKAVQLSAATKKPLLIEVATDWCHYCQKMERETFQNNAVARKVQDCFVPLRVDADSQKELAKRLGVRSFPTIIILSPEMKLLENVAGFRTAQQLGATRSQVCPHDHQQLATRAIAGAPATTSRLSRPSVYDELCPVTSLSSGVAAKGDPRFSIRFRNYDLLFASAEARNMFQANPARFWPVDDGYCRVAAVEQRTRARGSWQYAVTWSGRIWLFSSAEHMQLFVQRPDHYAQPRRIAAAEPVPAR